MDSRFVAAFVKSVQNVFSTMLDLPVTVGQPRFKEDSVSRYDASGVIGVSGDLVGAIVLSFPSEAAERVVSRFIGAELTADDPDFADAIGELVNMVAGDAKRRFTGISASISVPSVVLGEKHRVAQKKSAPVVEIPCSCEFGPFVVDVTLERAAEQGAEQAKDQAAATVQQ